MIGHSAVPTKGLASAKVLSRFKVFCGTSLLLGMLGQSGLAQSQVTLVWDSSPDPTVKGYHLYQGGITHAYTNVLDVGNVTQATFTNLQVGSTYGFAVSAYNAYGLDSPLSAELRYSVPVSSPAPSSPPSVVLTAPVSGASYTAPAALSLSASVSTNGHTISQVQFYSGTALLGANTVPPYTFAWSGVGAGSYSLFARVVYDGGSTLDSAPATISIANLPVLTLPAPWQTMDIGKMGANGSATDSSGVFTVTGAGNIGGTVDSFRFVYQPLSADGEIRARISASQKLANDWAGVMIRESLTPGSAYGFMGLVSGNIFRMSARTSTGASAKSFSVWTGTPPNVWVRLVRTGNSLYGYKSTDGVNWGNPVSQYTVPMAANIYVGLAVASGNANRLNSAVFSNLTVVP